LSQAIPPFEGFHPEAFKYLKRLEKNNNSKWFSEHKDDYENHLVIPAKSFIQDIAPFFNQLNPSIRTEPKFNQTIMRISNDMRFSKGDPYKNYFLIHFGRFKLDSEFYLYFDKTGIDFGLFLNNTEGEGLHFKNNLKEYEPEIKKIFSDYKLNGKFSLMQIMSVKNSPPLVKTKFNADKDYDKLAGIKMILLESGFTNEDKRTFSLNLLSHLIKIYSRLYPLYCFAVSPDPLLMLEQFEDNMGAVV
jgi:uncharacterized protein (TIGR02453 family)